MSKKLNEEELKKIPDVKLWPLHAHPCASSPPTTHTYKNKTFLKKYNIEESFNASSMVLTLYVVNVKLLENGLNKRMPTMTNYDKLPLRPQDL